MASKRNSRVYVDEGKHCQQGQQQQQQRPTPTNPREFRVSSKEDMMQTARAMEEGLRNATIPRDLSTINTPHSLTTASGGPDMTTSTASNAIYSDNKTPLAASTAEYPMVPANGHPVNFGVVIPGVYRSSYPKSEDYSFLQRLHLKTVITLVKKDERDLAFESFAQANGVRQVVFDMKGTKKQTIPLDTMASILRIVLDNGNYPLLLHCNHGRHRTGCVVGIIRKLSGWSLDSVLDEYKSYASPKARDCDLDYIRGFQSALLPTSAWESHQHIAVQSRTFFRTLIFSTFVVMLWYVSGSAMMPGARDPPS
ncbi:hypothetical protein CDD82_2049 [Ophiocordyceps australis]|uniref:diphosphoinositol-polyphosphate diphosphatase n=1 Tax=Ophiocordyceps australis TaxID=1399860 RepID=A0A2C5Y5B2_9HYPO|nr:hypothetical protein CDD82_2049 [Ophiocordyceps australis]